LFELLERMFDLLGTAKVTPLRSSERYKMNG